ncbi:hypothetical protein [Eubacterium ramulus]|uniref:hypothetical protein n=1 Tax=Eubacterium ramulus TaxID=39490 RepID=UPI003999921C
MERLTYRTELGVSIDKNEDCPTCSICWNCDIPPRKCKYISDVLKKLTDYEDLEEQNRLIILPCKMGDIVYKVNKASKKVSQHRVIEFEIDKAYATSYTMQIFFENFDSCFLHHFGETLFLTKSEAEAKLKELRGEENGSME